MITMSHLMNFWVLEQIFDNEVKNPLSRRAKTFYINCLMHRFKNRPARITQASAFNLTNEEFGNISRYNTLLSELHKAELVVVCSEYVTFLNVWGKYIDRSQLEKVAPDEYVAGFNFSGVGQFEQELRTNQLLHETILMKYRDLKESELSKLIDLFIKEQLAFEKRYNGWSDVSKHFTYWVGHNVGKKNDTKETSSKVVSKNKILGQ